jgi:RHS repeat-associated protein
VTYILDAAGQRTALVDWTGRTSSTFDYDGRLTLAVNPAGKRISYSLDAATQRTLMFEPGGGRFSYLWDAAGQGRALVNPEGQRTTWNRDAAGRVTSHLLANTVRASYSLDADDRLTRLVNITSGGTTISAFAYTLDKVGNRLGVVEANGDRVTWNYDKTYQLTHEQRSGANGYNTTYNYDLAGNRRLMIDSEARTTYTANAGNRLVTAKAVSGTTSFSFDRNGNMILTNAAGARTTYAWDIANRPTQVVLTTGVRNTFVYNGDGKRVQKQDSTGTMKQIWDLENMLEETDGNNVTQVVYTLALAQFGELISQRRGGATNFFVFDALGSTDRLTTINAAVTDSYIYKAFGITIPILMPTVNPYRFVGREGYYLDTDLSTYALRARIYDPETGRFLSHDPSGMRTGESNYYTYVGNRPLMAVDPSGHLTITEIGGQRQKLCDQQQFVRWQFGLDRRYAVEGYIVQQVKVYCTIDETCCNCPNRFTDEPAYTFYEACYIGVKAVSHCVDLASFTPRINTCGNYYQIGTVKFFLLSTTGYLGGGPPGDPRVPNPLWFHFAPVIYGTETNCPTNAPPISLGNASPLWWMNRPVERPETRLFWGEWNCCPDKGRVNFDWIPKK